MSVHRYGLRKPRPYAENAIIGAQHLNAGARCERLRHDRSVRSTPMPKPTSYGRSGMRKNRKSNHRRPRPAGSIPKAVKDMILEVQENRCLYCNNEFGTLIEVGIHIETVSLTWDHFIPYALTEQHSNDNLFAACSTCNTIKRDRVFDSVEEAVRFIMKERLRRGYR